MNKNRILSLEGIRAIAFIMVYMSHLYLPFTFANSGPWAVSIFFVLSGFVTMLSSYNIDFAPSLKNNFKYMISRIKKIYPIFLITTLVVFALNTYYRVFITKEYEHFFIMCFSLLGNLLFLQEYCPLKIRFLNGPAWYLSALVLSYLLFPFILKNMKQKECSIRKIIYHLFFIFSIQLLIGLVGYRMSFMPVNDAIFSNICDWFVYRLPFSRLLDIFIGYDIAYIYIYIYQAKKQIRYATFKEVLVVCFSLLTLIISIIFDKGCNMWWNKVLVFTPQAALLIYMFSFNAGIISKFLSNKVLIYFASISPYTFLWHVPILTILDDVVTSLSIHAGINFSLLQICIIKIVIAFGITVVAGELSKRMANNKIKAHNT